MFSGLFMAWAASVWFTEMRGWQIERALWFYRFYKKRLKSAPNCRRFEIQASDARVIYLALAAQVSGVREHRTDACAGAIWRSSREPRLAFRGHLQRVGRATTLGILLPAPDHTERVAHRKNVTVFSKSSFESCFK
jgi:hypothetical protein